MIRAKLEDISKEYKQEALEFWRASGRSAAKVEAELGFRTLNATERHGMLPTVPLNFLPLCCRDKAMKIPAVVLAAFLLGLPVLAPCQSTALPAQVAAAVTPAAVKGILAARRFTLGTPFPYTWTKEHVMVSSGTLVVLEVDPALVVPRDTLEPVLYAGNVPVMRLNHGHKSGRVVGIIPGNVDLATTPIWFGAPELPGRITTAMAEAERSRAEKVGALRTFGRSPIVGLDQSAATSEDLATLLRTVAADLVPTYSPQEKDLADQWRLPVAKAPRGKP